MTGLSPFNPLHLLHTPPELSSTLGSSSTPLDSILNDNQDNLLQDMTPAVKSAYTRLLAKNMMIKGQFEAIERPAAAKQARKVPRKGMTVAHLGTHQFSTQRVLDEAVLIREVSMTRKQGKGKDKASDLSIQLGLPLDEE